MIVKFNSFSNSYLVLNEMLNVDNARDVSALNKFRRCFTMIITNFKFFSEILFNLKIVEANPGSRFKTMATDGKSIIYNPDFVKELTEPEVIFVILHEIMHNANLHFARIQGRDPKLWNVAGDYAINIQLSDLKNDLKSNALEIPKKILLDEKYRNMSAELIYDELEKKKKENEEKNKDGGGKIEIYPGMKVRIKATGKTGVVREVKDNGEYVIDEIEEDYQNIVEKFSLFKTLILESGDICNLPTIGDPKNYKRDEFVPIIKPGQDQSEPSDGGEGEEVEYEGDFDNQPGGPRGEDDDDPWVEDGKGLGGRQSGDDGVGGDMDDSAIGQDIANPGSITEKDGNTVYEGNTALDKMSKGEVKEAWKKIRIDAASNARGTGSASFDRWIRKTTKPKVNWKAELKKFVTQIFNELSYAYFNKRYISRDLYLPGVKKVDKSVFDNVVIAIDTSGSINDVTLGKFGAELESLFKKNKIKKCHIIWCDSEIKSVQTFDTVKEKFKLERLVAKGGGGTSFFPPFVWIKDNILKKGKQPAFVIYFTDAYGDAPKSAQYGIKTYSKRVLWVVTDNLDASNLKFGKKIYLDSQNM